MEAAVIWNPWKKKPAAGTYRLHGGFPSGTPVNELPGNKEYHDLVTPEVNALLWDVIREAEAAGWAVQTSTGLLHDEAKNLGRYMLDSPSPAAAREYARSAVLRYASHAGPVGWWK
jgi:hypothetical protein